MCNKNEHEHNESKEVKKTQSIACFIYKYSVMLGTYVIKIQCIL